MSVVFQIVVPGDAVAWARPRVNNGVFFTAKKQRNKKTELQWLFMQRWGAPPVPNTSAVEMHVEFVTKAPKKALLDRPKLTRPDGDNLVKLLLDAGNKIIWNDDAQVTDFRVVKRYGPEAQTLIRIKVWPQ